MDTLKNDIQELKILFNTSPKLYEKADFQKLIHVIEHLAAGGQDQPDPTPDPTPTIKDHPQYRNDIENHAKKVNKKGKIKFTDDGYAICDKASSQNTKLFFGERIWINPNNYDVAGSHVISYGSVGTIKLLDALFQFGFDQGSAGNHIVLFYETAEGTLGMIDYGIYHKVFTYRLHTKYLDGKKQKNIIEKEFKSPNNNANKYNPELAFQETLKDLNLCTSTGVLKPGVRIYIKQNQVQESPRCYFQRRGHRNRFRYYRYGGRGSVKKGNFKWWDQQKDDEGTPISPKKYLVGNLINYLFTREIAHPKWHDDNKDTKSTYIKCIIEHYQFKKGVTFKYKFRVYHKYKLNSNPFEQYILIK